MVILWLENPGGLEWDPECGLDCRPPLVGMNGMVGQVRECAEAPMSRMGLVFAAEGEVVLVLVALSVVEMGEVLGRVAAGVSVSAQEGAPGEGVCLWW